MFKIKGILFHVGALQEFRSNMIKKECMVSRIGAGAYPNIVLEVLGEDIAKLDSIPLNSLVEIGFDIHGKSYTGKDGRAKYFNVLRLFNIEQVVETPVVSETSKPMKVSDKPTPPVIPVNVETAKPIEKVSGETVLAVTTSMAETTVVEVPAEKAV